MQLRGKGKTPEDCNLPKLATSLVTGAKRASKKKLGKEPYLPQERPGSKRLGAKSGSPL